jgi:Uma2 family endonuclease
VLYSTALSETMSTVEVPEFVSVDDYLASEEIATTRSKYIEGWVRAMTGATNRHNRVKVNCLVHLSIALKGQRCQPFDSDTKVRIRRLGRTRFYYPDLQVVCESNAPTEVFQDTPVLIVEVLSPSTRQYDLDEKFAAYLEIPSLECYIILEQHTPVAIVMRRTEKGFLRETYEGVEASILLPFLGCSSSLRDVYDGVEFTETCVQEPLPEYEVT